MTSASPGPARARSTRFTHRPQFVRVPNADQRGNPRHHDRDGLTTKPDQPAGCGRSGCSRDQQLDLARFGYQELLVGGRGSRTGCGWETAESASANTSRTAWYTTARASWMCRPELLAQGRVCATGNGGKTDPSTRTPSRTRRASRAEPEPSHTIELSDANPPQSVGHRVAQQALVHRAFGGPGIDALGAAGRTQDAAVAARVSCLRWWS